MSSVDLDNNLDAIMDCKTTPNQGSTSELFYCAEMLSLANDNSSGSSISTSSSSSSSLASLHTLTPESISATPISSAAFHLEVANYQYKNLPFISVVKNDVFGRYIIAKEDIPAGTIIVSEHPAAFGPDGDGCEGYEIPLCLGCCMIMNDDNEDLRCSKCNWPVCSKECEIGDAHANNECKLFATQRISFPPPVDIATCYKGIQVLRGMLLKESSLEKWNELMTLQDWTDINCTSRDFPGMNKFFSEALGLFDETRENEWNKILRIFNVNSFSFMMKCESEDRSPSFGEFLFLTTSVFSHSCAPNANWGIGCSPDFIMQVRTTVDVKKGEMISIPYTYDHMNFGTYGRVIRQQSFHCKCQRCLDPTELGTHNSTIQCYKCHEGLVLSLNPVDVKSEWKCQRCLSIFPGDVVILFVEALSDEVENCDSVEDLENFIATHRGKTLHPNHSVLYFASNSVLSNWAQSLETLDSQQLERFLWHCFYILHILDVLAPGSSLFRGNVLLLLSRALFIKTELRIREGQLTNKTEIVEEMKMVHNYQIAAFQYWKDDHSYRPRNETYGPEARDLIQEMNRIKNAYLNER